MLASSQAPTAPPSPPQPRDLALGLESHVEAEGAEKGGSLSQPGPACPSASPPGQPPSHASPLRPPRLYQGECLDFSTKRAKSKMRNKFSLGLPVPLPALMVNEGMGTESPQPIPYPHSHSQPRTPRAKGLAGEGQGRSSLPHTHGEAESLGLTLSAPHSPARKRISQVSSLSHSEAVSLWLEEKGQSLLSGTRRESLEIRK